MDGLGPFRGHQTTCFPLARLCATGHGRRAAVCGPEEASSAAGSLTSDLRPPNFLSFASTQCATLCRGSATGQRQKGSKDACEAWPDKQRPSGGWGLRGSRPCMPPLSVGCPANQSAESIIQPRMPFQSAP